MTAKEHTEDLAKRREEAKTLHIGGVSDFLKKRNKIMKVKTYLISDPSPYETRESIDIQLNDETIFYVQDGEQEDNDLSRNFFNCYDVNVLLEKFYMMGLEGIEVSFEIEQI